MFPGSPVRLQLYEEGGEVTLQKNDAGMGLPPAECHRVLLISPACGMPDCGGENPIPIYRPINDDISNIYTSVRKPLLQQY